jgi:signal peptidase I
MARATQNREALKLELAAEVLRGAGELRFIARGASMVPTIYAGDVLWVRRQPISEIRHGEVALWSRDGSFCAHRVIRLSANANEQKTVVTRGDALMQNDPVVHENEFLGRVFAIERRGRRIELPIRLGPCLRAIAWLAQRSDFITKWLLRYNVLVGTIHGREQRLPFDGPSARGLAGCP